MTFVYKIRNKEGKFSTGSGCPRFTKSGKIYHRIADIKRHFTVINQRIQSYHLEIYKDCDLVKYNLIKEETIKLTEIDTLKKRNIICTTKL